MWWNNQKRKYFNQKKQIIHQRKTTAALEFFFKPLPMLMLMFTSSNSISDSGRLWSSTHVLSVVFSPPTPWKTIPRNSLPFGRNQPLSALWGMKEGEREAIKRIAASI
jgi:hypothetical protein